MCGYSFLLQRKNQCILFSILVIISIYLLSQKIQFSVINEFKFFALNIPSNKTNEIEWLNVTQGQLYADYGDITCPVNPVRKTLKEIFKRWTEIATEHDIKYFIFAGSLLGAWRNGDVIPHDTDMDLLIDRKDGVKLEAIATPRNSSFYKNEFGLAIQFDYKLPNPKRRRVKCDGKTVKHISDPCSFQEPLARLIKNGRYLDIYDYFWKDGVMHEHSEYKKTLNTEDVFPLKKCRFPDIVTFCPNNTNANLRQWYKDKLYPQRKCKKGKWIRV